eukprot:13837494-Alexandrium_andersonii.AAC.1
MMVLAFFAAGWARAVRGVQVVPRALADDLVVVSDEAAPEAAFARGVEETLSMLKSVGCVVSVEKCVVMDSRPEKRKIARARRWGGQLVQMRVATDIREHAAT